MSTSNNRYGNEIRPIWLSSDAENKTIKTLSGEKLQRLMSNRLSDCTAISLANRGIQTISDMNDMNNNLRRLDLSSNKLTRLTGFVNMTGSQLSLLNVSMNDIKGDMGLEDLRYLTELRTLNISKNPHIKTIRSHVMKPLREKLQALIANDCGLINASFIRFLPALNTLVLSSNELDSLSMNEYGVFKHLIKLSLGRNKFTTFPDLTSCFALNELRINHNMLQSIPSSFYEHHNKNLRTLDISCNLFSDWNIVKDLSQLNGLTNLSLHGNPLCKHPLSTEDRLPLKEDISGDSITDPIEKEYRYRVLLAFQRKVGQREKLFVQLIVFDNKRVKTKWTQGGAHKKDGDEEVEQEKGMISDEMLDIEDSQREGSHEVNQSNDKKGKKRGRSNKSDIDDVSDKNSADTKTKKKKRKVSDRVSEEISTEPSQLGGDLSSDQLKAEKENPDLGMGLDAATNDKGRVKTKHQEEDTERSHILSKDEEITDEEAGLAIKQNTSSYTVRNLSKSFAKVRKIDDSKLAEVLYKKSFAVETSGWD